jgi:RNA polymerase sigma-70 factor, ECF subfamily
MEPGDDELLALLATNLDQNYVLLWSKYIKVLYAYAFRQTGNADDAEDVLQDTFLRVYTALDSYSEQKVAKRQAHLAHASFDTLEESHLDEMADEQAEQPEHWLEQQERRHALETIVMSLPEKYREVISLRYFDDFKPSEIADILQERDVTVRQRERRALALLRKALNREKDEV